MNLSSIEDAAKHLESSAAGALSGLASAVGPIDLVKVEQLVLDIISAAPAIQAAEQSALPFVMAIVQMVQNGGKSPSDEEWDALAARLDAGSSALQNAANEPDPNVQQVGQEPVTEPNLETTNEPQSEQTNPVFEGAQ